MLTLTNSLRRTEDSTEQRYFYPHMWNPVYLHGAQFCYSFNHRRSLGKQPARHSTRIVRSLARALAEPLQQEKMEVHVRGMLPAYANISGAQSW